MPAIWQLDPSESAVQNSRIQTGQATISLGPVDWVQIGQSSISLQKSQVQTGQARISIQLDKDQVGKARISVSQDKVQTGQARISIPTDRDQLGQARVTTRNEQTQTGVAFIEEPVVGPRDRIQVGTARVLINREKRQIGQANIVLAIPLNFLEQTLKNLSKGASMAIKGMTPELGYEVQIFFPVTNPSIYGEEDNRFTYGLEPNFHSRVIITGLFNESFDSDITSDVFEEGEVIMYIDRTVDIPNNSKVLVWLKRGSVMPFRVHLTRGDDAIDDLMYRKVVIVPYEEVV